MASQNNSYKELWSKLLSTNRYDGEKIEGGAPNVDEEEGRSQFQKDIDRIVFSRPFRRLANKTQVHPMAKSDHMHTRLTHTIEVSNVGKTLGTKIGIYLEKEELLPDYFKPHNIGEIVQAACLAHDIGNTPFGHAGEDAIKECLEASFLLEIIRNSSLNQTISDLNDHLPFEANAHGFRIIAKLYDNRDKGGMRLTYATLGAFMKYPWLHTKGTKKFGVFKTEEDDLKNIASHLGLVENKNGYRRHSLAYLVEAADDICNLLMDLEDGVEAKHFNYEAYENTFVSIIRGTKKQELSNKKIKEKMKIIRAEVIHKAVEAVTKTFIDNMGKILEGKYEYAKNILFNCSATDIAKVFRDADKQVKMLYKERRKVELQAGAFATVQTLLGNCLKSLFIWKRDGYEKTEDDLPKVPVRNQHIFLLMGDECPIAIDNNDTDEKKAKINAENLRRCIDFVAGMTDDFATYLALQLIGAAQ